jgi:hypothetical protein
MTIWILALILLGACIALGHKMGAIRTAITFVGILISALLAGPLSGLIKPLLPHVGVHNPLWQWALPPLLVFIILMIVFKSIGFAVDRKVYVYYKHYRSELEMGWWERMNQRVGLCVGALNALVYMVLLSFVIYDFSYWTAQVASSEEEKLPIRLLNRAGHDLKATGMIKVARAVDSTPASYFKMADLAGLLYQNPQLADRLAEYPPFLSLDERGEFQDLGRDTDFQNAWKDHGRLDQLLGNEHARNIWQNKEITDTVRAMVETNLDDLQNYLQTGTSQKFDEPIFGRWHFNVGSTIAMLGQSRPSFSSADARALRGLWTPAYAQTTFVAASDGQAFLKNMPKFKVSQQPNQPPAFDSISYAGQWTGAEGSYEVTVASDNNKRSGFAKVNGARLTLKLDNDTLIFDR